MVTGEVTKPEEILSGKIQVLKVGEGGTAVSTTAMQKTPHTTKRSAAERISFSQFAHSLQKALSPSRGWKNALRGTRNSGTSLSPNKMRCFMVHHPSCHVRYVMHRRSLFIWPQSQGQDTTDTTLRHTHPYIMGSNRGHRLTSVQEKNPKTPE